MGRDENEKSSMRTCNWSLSVDGGRKHRFAGGGEPLCSGWD